MPDNPDLRRGGVYPRPQHPMAPFGRAGVKPAPTRKGCSLDLITVISMRRNLGRSAQAVPVESCLLLPNESFGVGCLPVLGQQWGGVYPNAGKLGLGMVHEGSWRRFVCATLPCRFSEVGAGSLLSKNAETLSQNTSVVRSAEG